MLFRFIFSWYVRGLNYTFEPILGCASRVFDLEFTLIVDLSLSQMGKLRGIDEE